MIVFFATLLFLIQVNGLKIWIPNTDLNNYMNWDLQVIPSDCDKVWFPGEIDITTFWNLKDLSLTGLSLPRTGEIIFSRDVKIRFKNREKCSQIRDLRFIRNKVKGWLDPDNWKSGSESQWLPHSRRVPCAGEDVLFPPHQTYAIQLPSILVPYKSISFDNNNFKGDDWTKFLKTDLGYQIFKGSDDVRSLPWRNDIGCFDKKKCTCGRSSYAIKDGKYKEAGSHIFEEAVCLYAKPNCKVTKCYSPIIPEGHCCGICGAAIKLEDRTKDGMDIDFIKKQVDKQTKDLDFENNLKSYVGRTIDGNIQIIIVAENPDDTLKCHVLANLMRRKLIDQKIQSKLLLHFSGLTLSNYMFNSVSGVVFGTLIAVLLFFVGIYYIYMVLPKKKFQRLGLENPFTFARFINVLHEASSEENIEIGSETKECEETPQAFDNPMYSGNLGNETSNKIKNEVDSSLTEEKKSLIKVTPGKEFSNPIYEDAEKSELLKEDLELEANEFSEIKL